MTTALAADGMTILTNLNRFVVGRVHPLLFAFVRLESLPDSGRKALLTPTESNSTSL